MELSFPPLQKQVEQGLLVCPVTKKALVWSEKELQTSDGEKHFPIFQGVPVVLADRERAKSYATSSSAMVSEYAKVGTSKSLRDRFNHWAFRDIRTRAAHKAFKDLMLN